MALKTLVVALALTLVSCQDVGTVTQDTGMQKEQKETGSLGVLTESVNATVIAEVPHRIPGDGQIDVAPKMVAGTKMSIPQPAPVLRGTPTMTDDHVVSPDVKPTIDPAAQPTANAAQSVPNTAGSESSFPGLMRLVLVALGVGGVVTLTPTGRNALITAGIVSSESEFTKMSLKASSSFDLASFPMVQQAVAAMGCLKRSHDVDDETCRPLINDSDGEDEDEAELKVPVGSLSRPRTMQNIAEARPTRKTVKDDFNPNAPGVDGHVHVEDMIDFGSPPMQQEHHDDFFDEDDDF